MRIPLGLLATSGDWLDRLEDGTLPLLQADFKNNRYWYNGKTYDGFENWLRGIAGAYSRSSTAVYKATDGSQQIAPANIPRFDSGLGYLSEIGRTNKITCYKSNPASLDNITKSGDASAVLSIVDDSQALAAANILTFGPMVYKLDNSAGTTEAIVRPAGNTGNTNPHTLSVYSRVVGGASPAYLRLSDGVGAVNFNNTSYTRVLSENKTPTGSTFGMQIGAKAGQIIYFVMPQLEESTFVTSPITGGLGAITRASDVLTSGPVEVGLGPELIKAERKGEGLTGWNISLGSASVENGIFKLGAGPSRVTTKESFVAIVGVTYRIEARYRRMSSVSGTVAIRVSNQSTGEQGGQIALTDDAPIDTSWRTSVKYFTGTGVPVYIAMVNGSVGQNAEFSSISVREVGGVNATHVPIIVNDDFSTPASLEGWTGINANLSIVNGELEVAATVASSPRAQKSMSVVPGILYRVKATGRRGTIVNSAGIRIGTTVGGAELYNASTPSTTGNKFVGYFFATTETVYLSLGFGETAIGQTSYWDNIEIVEVPNLLNNGNFASSLSSWTTFSDGGTSATTWANGAAQLVGDGVNVTGLYEPHPTVPGRIYKVTASIGTNTAWLSVGTAARSASLLSTNFPVGTSSFYFIATTTTTYIQFHRNAASTGTVDNIFVSEVVPLIGWNPNEMTIVVKGRTPSVAISGNQYLWATDNDTSNERSMVYINNNGSIAFNNLTGAVADSTFSSGNIGLPKDVKVATRLKSNDLALYNNIMGSLLDTSASIIGRSMFRIGRSRIGEELNGHVGGITIFNKGASISDLERFVL